ncbi:MAG: hypothetical protein IPK26_31200 [Planctomycetes bacterium]|nr:hypothetical protein [Planctomycetota bacterium]
MTFAEHELQAGFAAFIAASQRLEQSYAELKARAQAVDLQLQATNATLAATLRERDALFAALPIGLLALRGDATVGFANPEGERLGALAAAAGCDLATLPVGEATFGDTQVRMRTVDLPDGRLLLVEDRSRIRDLEQRVHRLDRLAGLSELALGVAHEIKNPLNGVLGFAALLERAREPATCQRYAGKIAQGLRQIDDIVKAMLAFARPERGRGRTAPIGELVNAAATAANLPATRLELTGDGSLHGDHDALTRVLTNLFTNAIEAGGDGIRVRVHAAAIGNRLELTVSDDGPGVPAALGHRVLEPFVSSKERGGGLGLALSARVLAFLGGDLRLLNPGERGARFQIRLPLASPGTAVATA